jgi:outer membrane protein OmpA-like peptidoglycan-associated protein
MRSVDRVSSLPAWQSRAITGAGGALMVLLLASGATAQDSAQQLPARNVTAPQVAYNPGQEGKIKGLIIGRNGDDMTVHDDNGNVDIVTLTADTKIYSPNQGLFKLEKKGRDVTSLLPGLIVEIHGNGGDRGNLVASRISFRSSALKVAQQISAGEVWLDRRISANTDSIEALKRAVADSMEALKMHVRDSLAAINVRFDNLDKYSRRDSTTVNFNTASAELTSGDKQVLDDLIKRDSGIQGYLVEVTGFADDRGHSMKNQELSDRRAQSVVTYLAQRGVPLRRILNPTGLGEADPVASNATTKGRALNRRAEVKVLVNQGGQR